MTRHESERGASPAGHGPDHFRVDYDPALLEEAVLLAVRERSKERQFRRERDPIYETPDSDAREARFRGFHRDWFLRLGLGNPVEQALNERPILAESTRRCLVAAAPGRKDESAELFVSPPGEGLDDPERHSIGLMIRATSFLNAESLLLLLRHELLHIADMLDPAFEYTPESLLADDGDIRNTQLQERYRAMWDATIDGRLIRMGMAPASRRSQRLADFARTFSAFGERMEEVFSQFFDGSRHTHPELVAYSRAPNEMLFSRGEHAGVQG